MRYRCLDCSYLGKRFSQGACPACGSLRVEREANEVEVSPTKQRWQLVALALLWLALGYLISTKL